MASITIKPTAAFNHGDTVVFGSWGCIAGSTSSFQRYLNITLDPETRSVMLPEVATDHLIEIFDEIPLYNNVADLEIGSASNLNSTTS
jgi:hypothetical protein